LCLGHPGGLMERSGWRPSRQKSRDLGPLCGVSQFQHVVRSVLNRLLGLLVHPSMHARSLSSAFGSTYAWHARMPVLTPTPWPTEVRNELLAAAYLIVVAETNLRAPIFHRVSCTEATPMTGGNMVSLSRRACHRFCATDLSEGGSILCWIGAPFT
jgi:hypothetical protein